MLATDPTSIGNAGTEIEHQFKSQSGLRADLVVLAIGRNLIWSPRVPAITLIDLGDANGWIVSCVLLVDGPFEQSPKILHQLVSSPWRIADVKAAAAGDLEALDRLSKPLQAFIVSHLDDDQRKHLSAQGVAFIIPELDRFRRLGADELGEFERAGRTFTVPKPQRHRRDDNKNDLEL